MTGPDGCSVAQVPSSARRPGLERRRWGGVSLLAAAIAAACAHQQTVPADVARAFAGASARGDWDHAYAMLSEDYRRRTPLERFRAECVAEREAIAADAAGLARAGLARTEATVRIDHGDDVRLTLENGGWRLADNPLQPFGQESPRATLRTFVRAVDRARYDVLLRLVPARHRARVTVEALRIYWQGPDAAKHRRLLEILRANLDAPIIELGTEAQMPYGGARPEGDLAPSHQDSARLPDRLSGEQVEQTEGEVRFLLEDGLWRIDDAG